MKVTKHLDWLSITFPKSIQAGDIFPTFDWKYIGEGRHGYQTMYQDSRTGATVQSDADDPDMGTHLTLPGGALSVMRDVMGADDCSLIRLLTSKQGRVSRLDCAVNLHGTVLTPQMFKQAANSGALTAKAKQWLFVEGAHQDRHADTFYMGNRSSRRFMRVYDKNAESRIVSEVSHLRLELETKKLYARAIQGAMSQHPVETVITAAFEDFVTYDHAEFQEAMKGDTVEIQELGRKQTNTERWLLQQVVKALARACVLDEGFREVFNYKLDREINKLKDAERHRSMKRNQAALRNSLQEGGEAHGEKNEVRPAGEETRTRRTQARTGEEA